MFLSDFDFELPQELIAQTPLKERSASRMLAVDRSAGKFEDSVFHDLPRYLRKGDVLVINNTRVFPARLFGKTETGARIEIFLVEELADGSWETLARPARRLSTGKRIHFSEELTAEVVSRDDNGRVIVRFEADGDLFSIFERIGRTPLPPYIKRERDAIDADRERYQTVFASTRGAIAAPTAGLHFTTEMFDELRAAGIEIAEITLHVGYGTFEPVRVDDLSAHRVSAERFAIGQATADVLNRARSEHRRIIAIGTTTTRTLEHLLRIDDAFRAGSGSADLTITPGYRFRAVDALLTNFHLPQSSLLVLTSTFGGHELIMNAYRHAVSWRYRFYSYGDCMFIF